MIKLRLVWPAAGQHPADFFEKLKASGWQCTQYEAQEPVLVSRDKVPFVAAYSRRALDDRVLSLHKNLWILTRVQGPWGNGALRCTRIENESLFKSFVPTLTPAGRGTAPQARLSNQHPGCKAVLHARAQFAK